MADGSDGRFLEIYERALELEGAERDAYLREACAGDEALRQELEELLAGAGNDLDTKFLEPVVHFPKLGFSPGDRLDDFEIVREIGRGGMGAVYLARQVSLGREVAVKVLLDSLAASERTVERFHREARAAAGLAHPGIVPVFVEGTAQGAHFFAMEYVPGHSLATELDALRPEAADDGTLQPLRLVPPGDPGHSRAVAELCIEVAEALDHAHSNGLVHRDVKPQNILLGRDGRVRVVDFGLVRDESLGSITRTGEQAGTPHYMSPEQVDVLRAEVDHRSDVYALGVVLYELLTLERPFDGQTSAEIFRQIKIHHARSIRSLNSRVHRDLQTICFKAMRKAPQRRYASAAAFAADLRRFLSGRSPKALPPSIVERGAALGRRYPRVAASGGALAAVGLGVSGVLVAGLLASRSHLDLAGIEGCEAGLAFRLEGPHMVSSGEPIQLDVDGRVSLAAGDWLVVLDGQSGGTAEAVVSVSEGDSVVIPTMAFTPADDPEGMVRVPAGALQLADGASVAVGPFWIDEFEVTNDQYRAFLDGLPPAERSARRPRFWPPDLEANWTVAIGGLPVASISPLDADAYAHSVGKRLPTRTEWFWAGRGPDDRAFPWPGGMDDGTANRAQVAQVNPSVLYGDDSEGRRQALAEEWEQYLALCSAPGRFPDDRSWCGVADLLGNVEEWTVHRPFEGGGPASFRVAVGGSFRTTVKVGELAATTPLLPENAYSHTTGFRCVKSIVARAP